MRNLSSFETVIFSVMGGGLFFLFGLVVFTACNPKTPEERQASLEDSIITVSPKQGVECYILPGSSSTSPRSMSCIVVQR
jgi:hypothetical protein